MLTKSITNTEPDIWLRDGKCVYTLKHSRWRKGEEQFENRFSFFVQAGNGEKLEEAEKIAEQITLFLNQNKVGDMEDAD